MDLSILNEQQRQAVVNTEGPMLVLAGAGSGKTRVLTHRIAYLIEKGVQPWAILALTFTNKAAKEMQERVRALIGDKANDCWVSTFHSSCARILRRDIEKLGYPRNFTIYDTDDQQRVVRDCLKELNLDEKQYAPRDVLACISDAKNHLRSPAEWLEHSDGGFRAEKIAQLYTMYEEHLKKLGALDFDDLLIKTLELFAQHPPVLDSYQRRFDYILIDEYQDTNSAQYQIVRLLALKKHNLCVVGDDDQSIYGWRGADIHNITNFERDFPGNVVIKLEQNYRSTSNILDAANQVIAHNVGRKEKALWTERQGGELLHLFEATDERDEAQWIAGTISELIRNGEKPGDIAILYRVNALSRVLEETFVRSGLRYRVFGGLKFYERKEIKDLVCYLRVVANPADDIALRRIINEPKRSIGDSTVERLQEYAGANGESLYSAVLDAEEAGLSGRALKAIERFCDLMGEILIANQTLPLTDFVSKVIELTGYRAQFEAENTPENQTRLQNIDEFFSSIVDFSRANPEGKLEDYLENVALVTDQDRADDSDGAITLMTIHSAKGLEFTNVFVTGMEEYIFPTTRAQTSEDSMEEERRLCYVAITRARKRLYLTHARSRMLYGRSNMCTPSRFLSELPRRVIDVVDPRHMGDTLMRPMRDGAAARYDADKDLVRRTPASAGAQHGAYKGSLTPDMIPGVVRGAASIVRSKAADIAPVVAIFHPGDRVSHRKLGTGNVTSVTGEGADAKVTILFDDGDEKTFKVAAAPIIKLG